MRRESFYWNLLEACANTPKSLPCDGQKPSAAVHFVPTRGNGHRSNFHMMTTNSAIRRLLRQLRQDADQRFIVVNSTVAGLSILTLMKRKYHYCVTTVLRHYDSPVPCPVSLGRPNLVGRLSPVFYFHSGHRDNPVEFFALCQVCSSQTWRLCLLSSRPHGQPNLKIRPLSPLSPVCPPFALATPFVRFYLLHALSLNSLKSHLGSITGMTCYANILICSILE